MWYLEKTLIHQKDSMNWLDDKINQEAIRPRNNQKDYQNNQARFCRIVELYITPCYAIKNKNISLFKHALRKICIIFLSLVLRKPKYTKEILKQMHIFDIKVANSVFQKLYLVANALINSKGQPETFYEMELFLKLKNGEFKYF